MLSILLFVSFHLFLPLHLHPLHIVDLLSSVVFSFIPLLRPFIYQSVIIPLLPNTLISLIDAPVPFLIGFTSRPSNIPPDVIVFDLEDKTLKLTETLPELPKFREFEVEFLKYYNQLIRTYENGKTPYVTSSKQLRLAKHISGLFEKYLSSLFDGFRNYCIRDLTQRNKPITIFMKDSFLESIPKPDLPFYNAFLSTQMFFDYQDKRLRREDSRKKFGWRHYCKKTWTSFCVIRSFSLFLFKHSTRHHAHHLMHSTSFVW